MALELFVQLLKICGINMNFSSLVLVYSYRLPTILYRSQKVKKLREYDHEPGKSARKLRSTREVGS